MFDQKVSNSISYNNDKNIIFVARNDLQKNIQLLKDIACENDDFIFNVYGSGFTDNSFEMHKNINYKGYVKDKNQIYKNGILICTSNYEGGPLVSLEALSYGIPVITTKVGVFNNMDVNINDIEFINVFKTKNEANKVIDLYRKKENFSTDSNKQFLTKNFLNPSQAINKILNK
jgi:glycosyltransferase involved in cell wall biosynthesis